MAQYNNLDSVREIFEANKGDIAGIILEPVVGNSGYIEPTQEFLQVPSQLKHCSGLHHTVVSLTDSQACLALTLCVVTRAFWAAELSVVLIMPRSAI